MEHFICRSSGKSSSYSRGVREPERGFHGELGAWGWESEDKQQTLSRAGAQWCSLIRAVCVSPPRCAFGCSRGHMQVSSSLPWCVIAEPCGTPVPPAAPPDSCAGCPAEQRSGRGLGCTIDVAFVFLFKLAEAGLAGRPSVRCPGMHCAGDLTPTPELRCTPPCPLRGPGKSLLFLFYNITWFCKCCFLFRYLYFLLLKVQLKKFKNLRCKNFAIPQNIVKNKKTPKVLQMTPTATFVKQLKLKKLEHPLTPLSPKKH